MLRTIGMNRLYFYKMHAIFNFSLFRFSELSNAEVQNIVKIVRIFYALAQLDGKSLSKDSSLLYHWNNFNINMHLEAKKVYKFVYSTEVPLLFSISKSILSISVELTLMSSPFFIVLTNRPELLLRILLHICVILTLFSICKFSGN